MIKNYFSVCRQYLALKADNKVYFIQLCISSLLRHLIELLFPIFLSLIVAAATDRDFALAFLYVAGLGITYLAYVLVHHWNYVVYAKSANYLCVTTQKKVIDTIATFDEDFTKNISKSNLINTISNDVIKMREFPDKMVDAGCQLISIGVAIILLFGVNAYVGLLAFIFTGISFKVFESWRKKRNYHLWSQRKAQDNIVGLYEQVLEGNKEIKSFNIENKLNSYLNMRIREWTRSYFAKRKYHDKAFALTQFILGSAKYLVYIIFILLIAYGYEEVAALVLVIGYFERVENSTNTLYSLYNTFCISEVRIKRITNILNYDNKNMIDFGDNSTDSIKGVIDFNNVSFDYENKPVLRDVNFHIDNKSLTAIVGKSGSGKSTIFRLLLRLYKLDKGSIFIDDVDIFDYSKDVYPSNVSIATQKPFIFNMSIKDNLSLVDKNVDNQIAACKRAGIHDFIMTLPKGYNTILKEDATDVSGGQKQLISLARTLLSKSEILLFDEVTSSLDPNTTKKVVKVLKDLKKDHTVLMITHNPSLMKLADNIIVIDKGKVVAEGKHKELLNNKYYRSLQK